ncbi:MAG: hypothetical protein OXC30_02545 [Alphaproteobacteria bacterium]|nr:hypothetical protein [Alphaproteobacteria bacterium]
MSAQLTTNCILHIPEIAGSVSLEGLSAYAASHTVYQYSMGQTREVSQGQTGLHISSGRVDTTLFGVFINDHDNTNILQNKLATREVLPVVKVVSVRHVQGNNQIAAVMTMRSAVVTTLSQGVEFPSEPFVHEDVNVAFESRQKLAMPAEGDFTPLERQLPARAVYIGFTFVQLELEYMPTALAGEQTGREAAAFNWQGNAMVQV